MKSAGAPDANSITERDLAVLQQENIRVLNVTKQGTAALDDMRVMFDGNTDGVENSGSQFVFVSEQEETVSSKF